MTDAELAKRFQRDMERSAEELARLGYDANNFNRMLSLHGAVDAARRLVLDSKATTGLWQLTQIERLDTAVEMWVLLPWYEPLFDQTIRDRARRKLRQLDVDVDRELKQLVERLQPSP